ncbi:MAG: hypothetical protein ACD_79C01502G0001, partial [uncultured bacterium]
IASDVFNYKDIQVACETNDFTADERKKVFVNISCKTGNYFYNRKKSYFIQLIQILRNIIVYDLLNSFKHIKFIMRKIKNRSAGVIKIKEKYIFND